MQTLPPALQVERAVLHDVRAVHDAASFRFDDYEPGGQPSWLLATISPGSHSGSATILGGYIEANTGKLVAPADAQLSILKTGTWRAVASSPAGTHPSSGSYQWYQPFEQMKRFLIPEDQYSPFAQGGTVLFRPVPGKTDVEQFGAARVIFADWAANVPAAFAFHGGNPHLLDPAPPVANVAQLVQLATQGNQLLAVVAFRNLLSLGLAQPDWVRAQLVRVAGPLGVVFGYLTIVVAGPNVSRPYSQEALQVLDTASEPTLRALLLGSFAAGVFNPNDSDILDRARAVETKAKQRLIATGVSVAKDAQLSWILDMIGPT